MEIRKVPGKTALEITLTEDNVKELIESGVFTIDAKMHDRLPKYKPYLYGFGAGLIPLTIRLLYSGEVCKCGPSKPWWQFW